MRDNKHTHVFVLKDDYMKLKALQNALGQETIVETFHNLVCPQQKALTLVSLKDCDFQKLSEIKTECGFTDLGSVIHHIIVERASTEVVIPSKIMKDSTPMVLCGRPLSGKTHWVKNTFVPSLNANPVLVIDVNGEYETLKQIQSIRELDLSSNSHVRFCPQQHSAMASMQVKALFTELNMMVDLNKDALKNLVLIVEEAQSYKISWFNGFLYKSRHCVRKMLVVTPQTDCFQGLETFTVFH